MCFKNILAAALLLMPLSVAAQTVRVVSGKVLDSGSGKALEFVTVALRQADSTVVAGTMTDKEGAFRLSAPAGSYILEASSLGYRPFTSSVTLPASVDIRLDVDAEMLAAARLTENVRLIEAKLDKIVMNVGESALAQGSNGLDLLKKAPGVTVDKDGNVKLNGQAVAVWIDGRPSYLDGEALQALLKGTAGDSIDKFELMEHPSAKYDAAGQGGIINIRTKKNFMKGLSGSLGFNAGGMYFGGGMDRFLAQESAWANAAYRGKKTNTFVNISQGHYDFGVDMGIDTRQVLGPGEMRLLSNSTLSYANDYTQVKFGNDWFINDRNIVGVIMTLPSSREKRFSAPEHNCSETYVNDVLTESTRTKIEETGNSGQITGNLNYTHIFDESRSAELTANIDWYHMSSPKDNRQFNNTVQATGLEGATSRTIVSDNLLNIYSAKADYQTVLWKSTMLEAGGKWAMSVTDNSTDREETGLPKLGNVFTYRENIAAAYVSLARQFGKRWSLKLGLRGEYTHSHGDWISSGRITDREYFDLFPTVFAGYNPSDNVRLGLSYTRRINRPRYGMMDPAESYIDAHSSVVGNPEILPEYTDGLTLSSGFGQCLSVNLGYSYTDGMSTQIPSIKPNGDQVITWGNFGYAHQAYVAASVSSMPLFKWLDWTLNTYVAYRNSFGDADFRNESFSVSGYNCFTIKFPGDWKVEWDAWASSRSSWGYFIIEPQFGSDFAAKKTMLDGKLVLSLSLDDVFRTSRNDLKMMGIDNASSLFNQRYYAQFVKLGLSWNFGHAAQTRYRKVGVLDEASRAGGGSSVGK